ncbi:MAG: aldo/keto reductase [Bacteroidota bacterium]
MKTLKKYPNSPSLLTQKSSMGFGTSRIASVQTALSRKEGMALLSLAYDLGLRYFDTADIYGQGDAERLLGTFIQDKREEVFIASKAGFSWDSGLKLKLLRKVKPLLRLGIKYAPQSGSYVKKQRNTSGPAALIKQNFDPVYLEEALARSLDRLQTDYLDAFFLHEPAKVITDPEVYECLESLKARGLVRHIGLCINDLESWDFPLPSCIDLVQTRINPLVGRDVRAFLKKQKESSSARFRLIAHASYAPMALAKKAIHGPLFKDEIVEIFGKIPSPARLLLAYSLSFPHKPLCLSGTTKLTHLRENISASQRLPKLGLEEQVQLENIFKYHHQALSIAC